MTKLRARLPRLPRISVARLPMGLALTMVAAVWVLGCVWSFTEQTAFARAKQFSDPQLLPLVIDGLAAAMGGVAFAASLDARPAVAARIGTALAVLASALSNGLWAAERSNGPTGPDPATVAIGAGIPIAANIAFEVLLAELRRQVQRRRGLPAPVPLPTLRLARLLLSPGPTFSGWRREVLQVTDPGLTSLSPPDPSPADPAATADPGPPQAPRPGGGTPVPAELDRADTATAIPPAPAPAPSTSASGCGGSAVPGPRTSTTALAPGPVAPGPHAPASAPVSPTSTGARQGQETAHGPAAPAPPDTEDDPTSADGRAPGSGEDAGDEENSGSPERPESNAKVWRLAEYLRALGRDPAEVSGDEVVDLGLCSSARNGRRLRDRAVALCQALEGTSPPPRPDLSEQPRLLLPGEAPSLAIVAGGDSR